MVRTGYIHIIILIIATAGCSSKEMFQQSVVVEKSRLISITGVVTSINSTDVDKSGKNPRFMLHFIVKIESYDDGERETLLDPEVTFSCREKDLLEQTGRKLEVGEKVLITAHVIEKSPKVIAVYKIKFLN